MIYKQIFDIVRQQVQQNAILRVTDNAFIPFDPDNTDYANFKKEVLAGAELQDADGNVMTQEQADAFIATLP
jgi:hypothetical protein